MGDSHKSKLKNVKETFGTDFEKYCIRHKIQPKKIKCGAFAVPNVNTLRECIDVLHRYKDKLDNRIEKIQKYRPKTNAQTETPTHQKRSFKQLKTTKRKKGTFAKNMRRNHKSRNMYLCNLHLEVYMYDTPSTLPIRSVASVPGNYILNTAKSGKDIYEFIIHETMKDSYIVNYQYSVPLVAYLLERFQRRHKKFHYTSLLKNLTEKQLDSTEVKKLRCPYEIPIEQLEKFLTVVFHKIVPQDLFGKPKNVWQIKKAMFALLRCPRFESFNLRPYIEKLNLSSITWLMRVENERTQWLIISKFVKWFFSGFIVKVLRTQLHLTAMSTSSNERIYIRRGVWCDVQRKFARRKQKSTLSPNIINNGWIPPPGLYKLIPKGSSVRPIFVTKCSGTDKRYETIIFKFLKQLHVTNYGSITFHDQWKFAVNKMRTLNKKKMYLVSCDVTDAFGSVIQAELYNIIHTLSKRLPEKLILQHYAIENKNRMFPEPLSYKQFFCHRQMRLALPAGTLFTPVRSFCRKRVPKCWLLNKIRKYISLQTVKIRNKSFVIQKGIVQGTMLSPVFSDIYYSYIVHKKMKLYIKYGTMIRYMDDILYAGTHNLFAEEFLRFVSRGVSEYNCRFKKLKTQTNMDFEGSCPVKSISYIGYRINCSTLEIMPDAPKTDMRYLMSFTAKNDLTALQFFRLRLSNIASLKLTKLVLDRTINSRKTIVRVIRDAGMLQAKRARVLILELFDNVKEHARKIVRVIRKVNRKIAKHIIRSFLAGGQTLTVRDAYTWNKKILKVLWRAFKRIFKHKKILRNSFPTVCT